MKKMRSISFLIIFLFYTVDLFAVNDLDGEFTIFDVGQGNSQFVVYPKKKIGFLYDAGSASQQKHPKLHSMEQYTPFFQVKKATEQIPFEPETPPKGETTTVQSDFKSLIPSAKSFQTQTSELYSNEKSKQLSFNGKSSAIFIRDSIETSELDLLFVFLSHPDKDHINFINEVLPSNIKKVVFCGGQFIHNESKDVLDFIKYVKNQQKEYLKVFYPYTWGRETSNKAEFSILEDEQNSFFYGSLEELLKHEKIKGEFRAFLLGEAKLNLIMEQDKEIKEEFNKNRQFVLEYLKKWAPSQEDFLEQQTTSNLLNMVMTDENIKARIGEDDKDWKLLKNIQDISDKVFIWGMNYRSNNVNAQSTVMSFKISDEINLILTGDAEKDTFSAIKKATKKEEESKFLGGKNILVVPHHGAEDNISEAMIKLFKPDFAIIFAANGKQYGHPHRKLLKFLSENKRVKENAFEPMGQEGNKIISFGEFKGSYEGNSKAKTSNIKKVARLVSSKNVVATNFSGSIRFENGVFYRTFTNMIDQEGKSYTIDYSKHINKGEDQKKLRKQIKTKKLNLVEFYDKNHPLEGQINDIFKLKQRKTKIANNEELAIINTGETATAQIDRVSSSKEELKKKLVVEALVREARRLDRILKKPEDSLIFQNKGQFYIFRKIDDEFCIYKAEKTEVEKND